MSVQGLIGDTTAIAAGGGFSCAIVTGGVVKCWGENNRGQLGDGTTSSSNTAVPVCADAACTSDLSGVTFIAAGFRHACAVTATGGVKCWGENPSSQLGAETLQECSGNPCSTTPLDVAGLTNVQAVAAGTFHSCALIAEGSVQCWGGGGSGELGNGFSTGSLTSVEVSGLDGGAVAISNGGQHSCIRGMTIGAQCWGRNQFGQLGDETFTNSNVPVEVSGIGPKDTPTPTPIDTPTVAPTGTDTPTPPAATTPTPTETDVLTATPTEAAVLTATSTPPPATPTPTSTAPAVLAGDANCDGQVNAIDTALILQLSAGLLATPGCSENADVNGDGSIDSLDAVLILQFVAGLLPFL